MSVSSARRLIAVTNQRPFPMFHGANADAGRLILALRSAGWTIMLVSWRDSISMDSGLETINAIADRYFEESIGAVQPGEECRTPAFAQSRMVADERKREIVEEARRFAPELIFSIGLYGAGLGIHIARSLGVHHLYRSQAIERDYYDQLFALERERTPGTLAENVLRRVHDIRRLRAIARTEEFVLGGSAVTFEISAEDAEIRRSRCGLRIEHLPPCAPDVKGPVTSDRWIDLLYLGNLFMENNRVGLIWFLDEVLPVLRLARPQIRVVVAGKSVEKAFEHLITETGVLFLPNVADADKLLMSAKVAVNPIFSGNGTNVKTIDALWCGCGVVTTAVGIQGYGFAEGLNLRVAHSPNEFAYAVIDMLNRWSVHSPEAQRHRLSEFSIPAQGRRLSQILSTLPSPPPF